MTLGYVGWQLQTLKRLLPSKVNYEKWGHHNLICFLCETQSTIDRLPISLGKLGCHFSNLCLFRTNRGLWGSLCHCPKLTFLEIALCTAHNSNGRSPAFLFSVKQDSILKHLEICPPGTSLWNTRENGDRLDRPSPTDRKLGWFCNTSLTSGAQSPLQTPLREPNNYRLCKKCHHFSGSVLLSLARERRAGGRGVGSSGGLQWLLVGTGWACNYIMSQALPGDVRWPEENEITLYPTWIKALVG